MNIKTTRTTALRLNKILWTHMIVPLLAVLFTMVNAAARQTVFGPAVQYNVYNDATTVAGDFNEDGLTDLFMAKPVEFNNLGGTVVSRGRLQLLLQTPGSSSRVTRVLLQEPATGDFIPAQDVGVDFAFGGINIVAADLNNDGRLDAATAQRYLLNVFGDATSAPGDPGPNPNPGTDPGTDPDPGPDPGTDPGDEVEICAADFNGDGVADRRDLRDFRSAYNAGDSAADFNGDGRIKRSDLRVFRNAWNAGC